MRLQILLELGKDGTSLCGISFRIAWGKQPRSIHTLSKFFEVRKALRHG